MTDATAHLAQDPRVGVMVGNYRLVRRIGEGGMGTVYEAVHRENENRIAVSSPLRCGCGPRQRGHSSQAIPR